MMEHINVMGVFSTKTFYEMNSFLVSKDKTLLNKGKKIVNSKGYKIIKCYLNMIMIYN